MSSSSSQAAKENESDQATLLLLQKLEAIEQELKDVKASTQRMDNHIDFVHRCYVAFRFPLEVGRIITSRLAPLLGIQDSRDPISSHRNAPLLLDSVPSESQGGDDEYRTLVSKVEASALPLLSKDDLVRCERHGEETGDAEEEAGEKNEKNIS